MAKPERVFRTPGLILRRKDIGEADRLLTILTPRHGKLDAVAYGARKPTSRKSGHVELFTRVDLLLNRRREMGTVSQAEVLEPFRPIRENLLLGAYASYAVELLDRFTEMGDDDLQGLFDLLDQTLAHLCSGTDPRLVLRYYELHLLNQTGFRPELHQCVLSGEPVQPIAQYFSFADGGVVCPEEASSRFAALSLNALKLLRFLQRSPYDQITALALSEPLHAEVEAIMQGYLTYTLESRLQSADFIRRLRQRTPGPENP